MRLTERQAAVLAAAANGLCIKQTARQMGLAAGTVKVHLAAARRNLGAQTTTTAVARAVRAGLL